MNYNIEKTTDKKLILRRESLVPVTLYYVFAAIIIMLVAFGLDYSHFSLQDPSSYYLLILPILAIWIFNYATSKKASLKQQLPECITFNNEKGLVIIEQVKGKELKTYIKYSDIEGFVLHKANESNYYKTNCSVHMKKKDGSSWFLFEASTITSGEEFCTRLENHFRKCSTFEQPPLTVLPKQIHCIQESNKTVLRWKNPISLSKIGSLALRVGIVTACTISSIFFSDASVFNYASMGLLLILFRYTSFKELKLMYNDATCTYVLYIGADALECYEETKKGEIKNLQAFPYQELHGVGLDFYLHDPHMPLFIKTKEAYAEEEPYRNHPNSFKSIKRLFTNRYPHKASLWFNSLSTIEKLMVENWIQERIKEKTSVEIL